MSADDPQKVTAFLAKGKPTFTAAEMTAVVDQRMATEPPGSGSKAMNELATDPDAMTRWQRWQQVLGP